MHDQNNLPPEYKTLYLKSDMFFGKKDSPAASELSIFVLVKNPEPRQN